MISFNTSPISVQAGFMLPGVMLIGFMLIGFIPEGQAADTSEQYSSPSQIMVKLSQLEGDENRKDAIELLKRGVVKFPSDATLHSRLGMKLFENKQSGEAEEHIKTALKRRNDNDDRDLLNKIVEQHEKWARSDRTAVVVMSKEVDAGNLKTALAVGKIAAEKFPTKETVLVEYGRALMISGSLEQAEKQLREALKLDPLNTEARRIIEEIRATEQAQTSTEVAEWISIAKDKVGDFIVTFLALFTAFLVNSLMAPIALRFKLSRARKAFEEDKYDDFTDLMEGLLDSENFSPLRSNLKELIQRKSYQEAQVILNKYVNTLERLPTLLRILERENEKLQSSN
jgi:Flp pilus assembly protein TadD